MGSSEVARNGTTETATSALDGQRTDEQVTLSFLTSYLNEVALRMAGHLDMKEEITNNWLSLFRNDRSHGSGEPRGYTQSRVDDIELKARTELDERGYATLPQDATTAENLAVVLRLFYEVLRDDTQHLAVLQPGEPTSMVRIFIPVRLGSAIYAPETVLREGLAHILEELGAHRDAAQLQVHYLAAGIYIEVQEHEDMAGLTASTAGDNMRKYWINDLQLWVRDQPDWHAFYQGAERVVDALTARAASRSQA